MDSTAKARRAVFEEWVKWSRKKLVIHKRGWQAAPQDRVIRDTQPPNRHTLLAVLLSDTRLSFKFPVAISLFSSTLSRTLIYVLISFPGLDNLTIISGHFQPLDLLYCLTLHLDYIVNIKMIRHTVSMLSRPEAYKNAACWRWVSSRLNVKVKHTLCDLQGNDLLKPNVLLLASQEGMIFPTNATYHCLVICLPRMLQWPNYTWPL